MKNPQKMKLGGRISLSFTASSKHSYPSNLLSTIYFHGSKMKWKDWKERHRIPIQVLSPISHGVNSELFPSLRFIFHIYKMKKIVFPHLSNKENSIPSLNCYDH